MALSPFVGPLPLFFFYLFFLVALYTVGLLGQGISSPQCIQASVTRGIRSHELIVWAGEDRSCLTPRCHCGRQKNRFIHRNSLWSRYLLQFFHFLLCMLPNVKYLTFAIMSVIVVLCQRPGVVLTSLKPLAHLHVSLPWTDVASIAAWLYVAIKGKRTAKCCGGNLVHICTTSFSGFCFLVRTNMVVIVLCLYIFHPNWCLNLFTILIPPLTWWVKRYVSIYDNLKLCYPGSTWKPIQAVLVQIVLNIDDPRHTAPLYTAAMIM
jgi:hypothetical protein